VTRSSAQGAGTSNAPPGRRGRANVFRPVRGRPVGVVDVIGGTKSVVGQPPFGPGGMTTAGGVEIVTVGWVTVTVLVPVLVLVLVGDVVEGVSLVVAGETVVVMVDVETDVETDVLAVFAGLSTPQATRFSASAELWPPMSAPSCSTIDEPSDPLS
jgi:hypothetical protein